MAAGHNSHSSWFNSLVALSTRELESQGNDYLVQEGIPWYHQQATSAAASPYLASLHSAFTPAIFETPHLPQSSQRFQPLVKEKGRFFDRRRRELLGGSGGMSPQEIVQIYIPSSAFSCILTSFLRYSEVFFLLLLLVYTQIAKILKISNFPFVFRSF